MSNRAQNIVTTCGREIGSHEIAHIQEVLGLCPGLSRMELALTLCEHWGWVSAFYRGVSYRAAGWELLGETSGRGLSRPGYHYRTTAKLIFVRPLVRDFRALLCSSVSGAGGDR